MHESDRDRERLKGEHRANAGMPTLSLGRLHAETLRASAAGSNVPSSRADDA